MTYSPPSVVVQTGSASNPGGSNQAGLTVALVASFPKGPCWPVGTLPGSNFPTPYPVPSPASYIAASKNELLATWGDDFNFNDLAGWSGPGYGRLLYENDAGLTPQVLVVRTGCTQASVTVPNATGSVVWTATALLTIGGSMGNGLTVQYGGTTLTITSTLAGFPSETWTVPATATWAQIAAIVNGQSKLIYLNSASADTVTTADTTLVTLAGGVDGAYPTSSDINAGLDALLNLTYGEQPIHFLGMGFADDAANGVTKHALTNAIAMLANGQRPRVVGAVSPKAGGTGNLTTILAMGQDLIPAENGGDSGRAMLWANNQPYRIDPATGNERIYPGWATAAAWIGQRASTPVARSLGRGKLSGFTRFAEHYTEAERTGASGLLAGGVMVAMPTGRLRDQQTTAIPTSYRRDDNVDNAENWFVADLAERLDSAAIEIAAGSTAGVTIDDIADIALRGYVEQKPAVINGYELSVKQSSGDARTWEVDINYNPNFAVRKISPLSVQLQAPTITVGNAVLG